MFKCTSHICHQIRRNCEFVTNANPLATDLVVSVTMYVQVLKMFNLNFFFIIITINMKGLFRSIQFRFMQKERRRQYDKIRM